MCQNPLFVNTAKVYTSYMKKFVIIFVDILLIAYLSIMLLQFFTLQNYTFLLIGAVFLILLISLNIYFFVHNPQQNSNLRQNSLPLSGIFYKIFYWVFVSTALAVIGFFLVYLTADSGGEGAYIGMIVISLGLLIPLGKVIWTKLLK
jgi:hypothetical protein